MKKMRAKFICDSVTEFPNYKQAKLRAVGSDTPENQSFNQYTPSGLLEIMIDKDIAKDYFKPDKTYYLDFSKAGE